MHRYGSESDRRLWNYHRDCLLVDGTIKKQDTIVLLGFDGPIVTRVKALLTPHPMK